MGKEKDGFVIYKKFYRPISKLSDKQLGRLFRAIFKYQLGEVVEIEEDIDMAFEFFKAQFELDEQKYQGIVERNRENGRKGGARRGANLPDGGPDGDVEACGVDGDGHLSSSGERPETTATDCKRPLPNGGDRQRPLPDASESSDRYPVGATATDRKRAQANEAYKDKEKDKEKEKDGEESASGEAPKKAGLSSLPDYNGVMQVFNKTFGGKLPLVEKMTERRRAAVKARMAEYGADAVGRAFLKVLASPFLLGRNGRGWRADFDWIFSPGNFTKILEGTYDDRGDPGLAGRRLHTDSDSKIIEKLGF